MKQAENRKLLSTLLPPLLVGILFIVIFLGMTPLVLAPTENVTPSAIGTFDTTGDLLADIQADDATIAPPGSVTQGDGVYTTTVLGEVCFIDGFDTSGMSGTVTAAVLHLQYGTQDGYGGTNYVRYALDGQTLENTTILPIDTKGGWSTDQTFDLLAAIPGLTLSQISTLDIEFTNNDSAPFDALSFDYVWVEVTTEAFDFSVSASPTSAVVKQGDSTSTQITVTLVSGSAETVSLSGTWVGTAPGGVTPSFVPSSGTPTFNSTLTFSTTATASTGTFTYRISGQDGGLMRSVDVTLQISETAPFDFSVSVSPDEVTLARSDSTTSTITIGLVSGTAETVSLSGTWIGTAPTGISASFSPQSGTPSFNSTLTFTTTSTAGAGTFTYRVTGQDGDLTRTDDITVTIMTELTLTLATDNENYEKGQTIQISGTAMDPKGNPVASGTATIQLSSGDWGRSTTVQITNGSYRDNYQISFGDPERTWTITVTAQDDDGNSGSASKNIGVRTPPAYAYYTVQILSPVAGLSYSRGSNIDISVKVTEGGANVENAEVSLNTPVGGKITLNETLPGTYTGRYTLRWDDPAGTWSISVEGKKTIDNTFKAGGNYINIQIEPATLQITLLSPTERKFEVGQSVKVSAEVSYPDGTLIEDVIVGATTPAGENLILAYESPGIYGTNYVITEQDVGTWILEVSAADLNGNSGSKKSAISIVPMGTIGIFAAYWWAVLSGIVAIGVASAFVARRVRLSSRLKKIEKEKREIPKLKKEADIKYFKEGAISRDTYDELIKKYDTRLEELRREELVLQAKVKKRGRKRKIR